MLKKRWIWYLPITGLLLYNALFFVLKNGQALGAYEQRLPDIAQQFIAQHIPKGSKVIGEPLYFYAVINNGSDYQYMNLDEDLEVRERFHREVYNYDYLLVTAHLEMRDAEGCIQYYLSQAEFEEVARLKLDEGKWAKWISSINIANFHLLSNVERHTYSCKIYKRLK